GGGTGPLNPLAAQVRGNVAPYELAVSRILSFDPGAWNVRVRWQERDPLIVPCARRAARDPGGHDLLAIRVEGRQCIERRENFLGEDVWIGAFEVRADLQGSRHARAPTWPRRARRPLPSPRSPCAIRPQAPQQRAPSSRCRRLRRTSCRTARTAAHQTSPPRP